MTPGDWLVLLGIAFGSALVLTWTIHWAIVRWSVDNERNLETEQQYETDSHHQPPES